MLWAMHALLAVVFGLVAYVGLVLRAHARTPSTEVCLDALSPAFPLTVVPQVRSVVLLVSSPRDCYQFLNPTIQTLLEQDYTVSVVVASPPESAGLLMRSGWWRSSIFDLCAISVSDAKCEEDRALLQKLGLDGKHIHFISISSEYLTLRRMLAKLRNNCNLVTGTCSLLNSAANSAIWAPTALVQLMY